MALIQMSQLKEKVSLETILETLGGAGAQLPSRPPPPQPPSANVPASIAPPSKAALNAPAVVGPPHTVVTASTTAPVAAAPGVTSTAKAEEAWKAAVEKFALERPLEADTIRAVQFHTCKADLIEVMLPPALEKKIHFLRSPRNLELLEKSLADQLGGPMRLVFIIGEGRKSAEAAPAPATTSSGPAAKPAPPPPTLSPEDFKNDPVIQNALKIFEAKIVAPASR